MPNNPIRTKRHSATWDYSLLLDQSNSVATITSDTTIFGGYYYFNPNEDECYVQLFDTTESVTLGTTVPDLVYGLPALGGSNEELSHGVWLTNGLKVAVSSEPSNNIAPSIGVTLNIYYKIR